MSSLQDEEQDEELDVPAFGTGQTDLFGGTVQEQPNTKRRKGAQAGNANAAKSGGGLVCVCLHCACMMYTTCRVQTD